MYFLGFHNTIQFGLYNCIRSLHEETKCNTVQICTKSPQTFIKINEKTFGEEEIKKTKKYIKKNKIRLFIHGQYILNGCNPDKKNIHYSVSSMVEDIEILNKITPEKQRKYTGVVLHLGKNTKKLNITDNEAIENFYQFIKKIIEKINKFSFTKKNTLIPSSKIIIETSSHQGTEICWNLEELAKLHNKFSDSEKYHIRYCIDTCHIFAAGYDLRTEKNVKEYINKFDKSIGIKYCLLFHLNDSKFDLGCKKDRHESIGEGYIFSKNSSGLSEILNIAKFNQIPIVLETPAPRFKTKDIKETEVQFIQKLLNN